MAAPIVTFPTTTLVRDWCTRMPARVYPSCWFVTSLGWVLRAEVWLYKFSYCYSLSEGWTPILLLRLVPATYDVTESLQVALHFFFPHYFTEM